MNAASSLNLYCFWTGDNLMKKDRLDALNSLKNTGLNVILITQYNLKNYLHPDFPLHPTYNYLSAVHRADYLRTYFMHIYGGAYSDIKFTTFDWTLAYTNFLSSSCIACGYTEPSFQGVEGRNIFEKVKLKIHYKKLIGNCAYIFKKNTDFTQEWYYQMISVLDKHEKNLYLNPANVPEDHFNKLINGKRSNYPLRWTEMLGNIFHPLCYKYRNIILHELPTPDFIKSKYL